MTTSFGKPPAPANMPTFGVGVGGDDFERELQNQRERNKLQGSKGPRREYFSRWKWPVGQSADVVLVAGQYRNRMLDRDGHETERVLQYFRVMGHYHGGKSRFANCSAVPYEETRGEREKRCSGCKAWSSQWKQDDVSGKWSNDGPVSRSESRAFTLAHVHPYYEVPDEKTDAQGRPYKKWVPGKGRNCPYAGKYPKRDFQRFIAGLNMTHFFQLVGKAESQEDRNKRRASRIPKPVSIQDQVRKCCLGCGKRDVLTVSSYECAGCDCPIIDVATSHLSDEQIEDAAATPQKCPACAHVGMLRPRNTCRTGCANPQPSGLFDGVMRIMAIAGQTGATDPKTGRMRTPPLTLSLQDWYPIPADLRAQLQPIELEVAEAPATPEQQELIFGERPEMAPAPTVEQQAKEVLHDGGEAYTGNDDIPF